MKGLCAIDNGYTLGEGACGKVVAAGPPGVVVKRVHRRLKHRAKCLDARAQCALQQWANELLTPANGFSVLFSPRAWTSEVESEAQSDKRANEREYLMELIDCSSEMEANELASESPELTELRLFYEKARSAGIYPCDYELYRQPGGRVALIDFDKFGKWNQKADGDEVVFPWGLIGKPLYPWYK